MPPQSHYLVLGRGSWPPWSSSPAKRYGIASSLTYSSECVSTQQRTTESRADCHSVQDVQVRQWHRQIVPLETATLPRNCRSEALRRNDGDSDATSYTLRNPATGVRTGLMSGRGNHRSYIVCSAVMLSAGCWRDGADREMKRRMAAVLNLFQFPRVTSIAQTSSSISQRGLHSLRPVKLLRQLQTLKTTIASTTISRILRNPTRSWHPCSIPSINSTPTEARHRRATCSTASSTRPG